MADHRHTYRGVYIFRQTEPGYKLRWYTIVPNLAADTLAGIKRLIAEHVDG
jgi:hypothetical protein